MVTGWPANLAGRYQIEEMIGRGGMGAVIRAVDDVLRRRVAIKMVPGTDANGRERVLREARIAASLTHHGICKVFDFFESEGAAYIVMELLDGSDLQQVLAASDRMGADQAATIGACVADALAHAHSRGAVHRDIKPANIFLGRQGQVWVTDFGIALAAEHSRLTRTGDLLGTVAYMSPEQALGDIAGPASDVYSLGCVMFETLCGRPPFLGDAAAAVIRAHLDERPPGVRSLNPDIPEALDLAVAAALDKVPERRPPAARLAEQLRGQMPAIPPAPSARTTRRLRSPPAPTELLREGGAKGRRRPNVPLLVASAAAIAIAVVVSALIAGPDVTLPKLNGRPFTEAAAELRRLGLEPIRRSTLSAKPEGTVLTQNPKPGAPLDAGSRVVLLTSDGAGVLVPGVVGIDLEDAERLIEDAGLESVVAGTVTGGDPGVVVSQTPPAGEIAPRGGAVRLTISIEEEQRERRKGKGRDRD